MVEDKGGTTRTELFDTSDDDLKGIDEVLMKILSDNPTLKPEELTAEMLDSYIMNADPKEIVSDSAEVFVDKKEAQKVYQIKDMSIEEKEEERMLRGKAECTSAAV